MNREYKIKHTFHCEKCGLMYHADDILLLQELDDAFFFRCINCSSIIRIAKEDVSSAK